MARKMKIDFYHLKMPPGAKRSFVDLLEMARGLPDEARAVFLNGVPFRLQELRSSREWYLGDMLRIRMEGLPPVAKITGEEQDLDIPDDAGLGEETAFLFFPAANALLLQRNRMSVSAAAFEDYFSSLGTVEPDGIALDPILRRDAMVRLMRMGVYRKFTVTVAGLQNMRVPRASGLAIKSMINISQEFRAPSLTVEVSMGHGRGTLTRIRETISQLGRILVREEEAGERVTRMLVRGKDDPDEPVEVVDLIEDRLVEAEDVNIGRKFASARRARQNALLAAFTRNRDDLVARLESPRQR